MKILKISIAVVALLISSYAWCQTIHFNVSDGDTVSMEGLTLVVKVNDLPNIPDESVQSRLYVQIRDDGGGFWAGTANLCQLFPGSFNYSAFRMEMVNQNSIGNYWCVERENLSVVVKSVPLDGKFQVGDELEVWVEFEWAKDGWHSVSDSVHLVVE